MTTAERIQGKQLKQLERDKVSNKCPGVRNYVQFSVHEARASTRTM